MPCNIGYRDYSRVRVPTPKPQEFKEKIEAPKIDAELLEKIGEEDPEFLEWMQELDITPLLQEALKRALSKIDGSDLINFSITVDGYLEASTNYTKAAEKEKLEKTTNLVFNQFQIEVLGIVAQLLDYEISIFKTNKGAFVLGGEKIEEKNVHKYLKITKTPEEDSSFSFEHFESPRTLAQEKRKFFALAQKLGIKITILQTQEAGQPIPEGTVHKDFLKQ